MPRIRTIRTPARKPARSHGNSGDIDVNQLVNDYDYALVAMVPYFAKGVAQFAGKPPSPLTSHAATVAGMAEVMQWWCDHGPMQVSWDAVDALVIQEPYHVPHGIAIIVADHMGFGEMWGHARMPASKKVNWSHCGAKGPPGPKGYAGG